MALNLLKDTANEDERKKSIAKDRGPSVLFTEPVRETAQPPALPPKVSTLRPTPPPQKKTEPSPPKKEEKRSFSAKASKDRSKDKQETVPEGDVTQGASMNLLTGEYAVPESTASLQRLLQSILFSGVGTIVIIGAVFSVLWFLTSRSTETLRTQDATIQESKKAIAALAEEQKEIRGFLDEVDVVQKLLRQHVRWTRFLSFLERVTLRDVYYTNLSVNPEGAIHLAAIGRDFTSVARQLLSFEHADEVQKVRMTNASAERADGDPVVVFDLELSLKPELLFSKELPQ